MNFEMYALSEWNDSGGVEHLVVVIHGYMYSRYLLLGEGTIIPEL
jgi:hypothetical protein